MRVNINIIGMRGAGKSNVSRRLAVLTKRSVFSTDTMIEYEWGGESIMGFIGRTGDWRAFREVEFEVIRRIVRMDDAIVDCGGGVVVDLDDDGVEVFSERKVDLLRAHGPVVWLRGNVDRLVAKVEAKADRPSLDLRTATKELMMRRLPYYERASDIVIDIEGKSRSELAREIRKTLGPRAVVS